MHDIIILVFLLLTEERMIIFIYRVYMLFSQLNLKLQIKLQIFLTPLICNLQFYAVLVYWIFMFPNMIYTCKQIRFLYLICTCLYKESNIFRIAIREGCQTLQRRKH